MPPDREWSPHPLHRPGFLLVGLLQSMLGIGLVADHWAPGRFVPPGWLGYLVALAYAFVAAALYVAPSGPRWSRLRLGFALGLLAAVVALWIIVPLSPRLPLGPGGAAGAVLLVAGIVGVVVSEVRRRRIRIALEGDLLTVHLKPYRVEHTLPLEAVRDMVASRPVGGRVWGYGDFTARVRKGTMKDHLTKPVVGEEPPDDATSGNGWDEEERFHLVAAHPYGKVRRDLEKRILLARMSPKEREEQELADRLAQDLGGLKA